MLKMDRAEVLVINGNRYYLNLLYLICSVVEEIVNSAQETYVKGEEG